MIPVLAIFGSAVLLGIVMYARHLVDDYRIAMARIARRRAALKRRRSGGAR